MNDRRPQLVVTRVTDTSNPDSAPVTDRFAVEVVPAPGRYDDNYDHWFAVTRLENTDRVAGSIYPGSVVHFTNTIVVRAAVNTGDVAIFATEPAP